MPCETCSHTMNNVAERVWWCPRCGTLTTVEHTGEAGTGRPVLVDRCRKFEEQLGTENASGRHLWRTFGIDEAINRPEDRP